jgi:hypothetical protein
VNRSARPREKGIETRKGIKEEAAMLRGATLDAPGTLHHGIVLGIEQRKIVDDTRDRENFLSRLGEPALDTGTEVSEPRS